MPAFSQAVGRYVTINVEGTEYRVFFLEAGEGPALLLQHGGGSHNHLWRHALEDPELLSRYRVVAFDLPHHGKSDPPAGAEWWNKEYRLTADFACEVTVAMCDALKLSRPLYAGQASAGNLALQLAWRMPEMFRGVIAIEGAAHTPGSYLDWWQHPQVNAAEMCAAGIWDQMAPQSPEAERWATAFYFTQGAEAFRGDLYFYSVEHDLRGQVKDFRTDLCPVVLMSGEYAYTPSSEVVKATADRIPGATFVDLPGIGHFPMSENWPVFRGPFLDALDTLERAVNA